MARTTMDIATKKSPKELGGIIASFMQKEGFKKTTARGEEIWKKGVGLLTAPQFLKTEIRESTVHLEAWLKTALLPGVYVGEMGTTGAYAFAVKAVLRKRVEKLKAAVEG
ncbi:MAG: hypothetical protein JXD23_10465 [Spirochaetales bacterium]|nr:hypothetical protein [Spirochaetales bacterium]